MKDRTKKKKNKAYIKVVVFLLAAWVVVSAAFSVFVYYMKFNNIIDYERVREQQFLETINRQDEDYIQMFLTDFYSNWKTDYSETVNLIDTKDLEIVVSDKYIGEGAFNCDDDLLVSFYGRSGSEYDFEINGYLHYTNFLKSMTEAQYKEITSILRTEPEEVGKKYALVCTEFYYGIEGIKPKIVEIALLNENDSWYQNQNVIKTYELTPEITGKIDTRNKYYHWNDSISIDEYEEIKGYVYTFTMDIDHINVIPSSFVLANYNENSQEKPVSSIVSNVQNQNKPELGTFKIEHVAPFTYVYSSLNSITVVNDYNNVISLGQELFVRYEKSFNVLLEIKDTLCIGIAVILVFFFSICVVINIMLKKVLSAQEEAAQKRRDLTNALAHDIKTPLFIIGGYAQSLKENLNTDKKDYYADRIIQRTKEVNLIVHQILSLVKLDASGYELEREDTDISEVLDDILADYPKLPDNRSFRVNKKSSCIIYADKYAINRALRNIIENAIKYSDRQTVIGIEFDERAISISNVASNISEESVKHFADAYYRGDKSTGTEGSGLGLTAVKTIVDMHGFNLGVSLDENILTVKIVFRHRDN